MAAEAKISDEAVETRTGKSWAQWFRILDRWGAAAKGHKATAAWLHDERDLPPWWAQMVTVRYERERGLRQVNERADGFAVSVSRLMAATPARVFDAITKPADLSRWFTRGARANVEVGGAYSNRDGDRGRFLAVARPRRLRMTWENENHAPGTIVEFAISATTGAKSRVEVTHARLASKRDAATMKEAWSWALDSLRSYLETGKPISVEAWEAARKEKSKARAKAKRSPAKRAPAVKRAAAGAAVKKRIRASA
ncbi:MAG TPA: SRPBCC domain-containing protein [Candidatus Eisenbacteria bacterium]|nr:SRPBCC domain-containing protein [Candidatus Eisenbacteria bacterium]